MSWAVSIGSIEVNSIMKSANTCPLIVVLGLYLISNSLRSMAHLPVFLWFLVYAVFASLCVLSKSRWCELGSMVEVFWRWSPILELASPSSDTFPLLLSKVSYSNRPAVAFYPAL